MSWRLPPPIWMQSGSGPARRRMVWVGRALLVAALGWRLLKWSVVAGFGLTALRLLTRGASAAGGAIAWIGFGAALVLLWERYGVADSALTVGRGARWIAAAAVSAAAGAGAWAVAHFAGRLVAAMIA